MKSKITIVIADDHPIFRRGLMEIIESDKSLEVVAEASDGEEALERIHEFSPTVALLDLDMPALNGFDIVKRMQEHHLATNIIFLTMHSAEDLFNEAMDLGVRGYVLKENAANDVLEGIKTVAKGGYYLSPLISKYLITRSERARDLARRTPGLELLTPAERRILRLIGEKKTSKEIADELFISYKTVENHRVNIAKKLELHGSHSLMKFAIENKSRL